MYGMCGASMRAEETPYWFGYAGMLAAPAPEPRLLGALVAILTQSSDPDFAVSADKFMLTLL